VAQWLRDQGHEVFSVYEEARGMNDDDIIHKAFVEDWILISDDKYFERTRARVGLHHRWLSGRQKMALVPRV
jgi:uncharacterized protein with PIN domain